MTGIEASVEVAVGVEATKKAVDLLRYLDLIDRLASKTIEEAGGPLR